MMNSDSDSCRKHGTSSSGSLLKKNCFFFGASLHECLTYVKAFFVGQTKKVKAGNEEEATAADLDTQKMQVEAADAAEQNKTKLKIVSS